MDENLWGFTKFKKTKILKISAFYLDKQKSFIPNAMPSAMQFSCNMKFDVSNYLYVVNSNSMKHPIGGGLLPKNRGKII